MQANSSQESDRRHHRLSSACVTARNESVVLREDARGIRVIAEEVRARGATLRARAARRFRYNNCSLPIVSYSSGALGSE